MLPNGTQAIASAACLLALLAPGCVDGGDGAAPALASCDTAPGISVVPWWPSRLQADEVLDQLAVIPGADSGTSLSGVVELSHPADGSPSHVLATPLGNASAPFSVTKLSLGTPQEAQDRIAMGGEVVHRGSACDVALTTISGAPGQSLAYGLGEVPSPGQGAHVRYAGFFEDGRLFGTNMPHVDAIAALPRWDQYAFDGDAPLPVYVYDADRSEQGPQWLGAGGNAASLGAPAEASSAAGTADGLTGIRYYSTIKGFNEALKSTSTATTRVVKVAPEDAYTREGNEDHPLYGEAIIFLIGVEALVDQPCPVPSAAAPLPVHPWTVCDQLTN